jgi:hypothetical protein
VFFREACEHKDRCGRADGEYFRRGRHEVGRNEDTPVFDVEEDAERRANMYYVGDRDEVAVGHRVLRRAGLETQESKLAANFAELGFDLASKERVADKAKVLHHQLLALN